ncbi:hypothetical protein GCM10020000_19670 [Streptomyces olivoverticillatus]
MGERTVTSGGAVLRELIAEGVSPWLDGLCRSSLTSGLLARLVTSGAVRGAAFEPAALARDLTGTTAYHQQLAHLACRSVPLETAVHALCAYDLRSACDELRPVFEATDGLDGQVSMDLDPALAHDAPATVAAAAELHRAACRPNALVKIPATDEGLAAIVECLGRGIGVHVTEVFSVRRYGQVVDAYFEGLERALEKKAWTSPPSPPWCPCPWAASTPRPTPASPSSAAGPPPPCTAPPPWRPPGWSTGSTRNGWAAPAGGR